MKISVALCTYNGEKYIEQQLRSILNQSVPVDEIIVSDDNSTDSTLVIAESILSQSQASYTIIRNTPAKGIARNFLDALKLTRGDYCFTCDQDDVWCPNKVARFLSCAKETGKDLYYSDGILIDFEGNSLGGTLWKACGIRYEELNETTFVRALINHPIVTGAAMMVSRKLIDRIDTVPAGILHDEWFSMIAAVSNSAQAINETTFLYRQHGNNVVGAKRRSIIEKAQVWWKNLGNLTEIRQIYLNRVQCFYLAAEGTEYQDAVKKAKEFWETMHRLSAFKKYEQLRILTVFLLSKQYTLYYTGLRGYLRDVLSLLL